MKRAALVAFFIVGCAHQRPAEAHRWVLSLPPFTGDAGNGGDLAFLADLFSAALEREGVTPARESSESDDGTISGVVRPAADGLTLEVVVTKRSGEAWASREVRAKDYGALIDELEPLAVALVRELDQR